MDAVPGAAARTPVSVGHIKRLVADRGDAGLQVPKGTPGTMSPSQDTDSDGPMQKAVVVADTKDGCCLRTHHGPHGVHRLLVLARQPLTRAHGHDGQRVPTELIVYLS